MVNTTQCRGLGIRKQRWSSLTRLDCSLEEKGVLKEVQAFIRQRLVIILKGAWPNLVQTKCDTDSHFALALIQDFLCTHKLLFTDRKSVV